MAVPAPVAWSPPGWMAAPDLEPMVGPAAAFVLGALLGSFLNVVAHRVPRGDSFVRGRSRCPRCGAGIRARDNVPVLGWLLLGGRCRDCRSEIPRRYPLVELGCGILLAMLAAAGGPLDDVAALVVFAERAAILLTLVAWGLLAEQGHAVTARTALAAAVLAAGFAAWPALRPPGWSWDAPPSAVDPVMAAVASLVGGLAGWCGGHLVGGVNGAAAGMLIGAGYGWQAAAIVIVTAGIRLAAGGRRDGRGVAGIGAGVLLVVGWQQILPAWRAACGWLAAR
jgi:leader peptidase (prepilin peptidase)/N-methyltransferase